MEPITKRQLLRNLLPQDTRSIEILSSTSLLILSFLFMFVLDKDPYAVIKQSMWMVWGVSAFGIGMIQMVGIIYHPHKFRWRIVGLWLAGGFWIGLTLSEYFSPIRSLTEAMLSLSCFVAFITNLIIASEKNKNRN